MAILNGTIRSLRTRTPGLEILRVGAIFYAHRGAQSAVRETSLIATVSIVGTIILILAVFRDPRPLWLTLSQSRSGSCAPSAYACRSSAGFT